MIIGRLGADPEMRYASSGQPVANFSVATNRKYKNAGGEDVKETVWFKVSAWGKMAEACNNYVRHLTLIGIPL
jgi:single-strand DNA-binding protein